MDIVGRFPTQPIIHEGITYQVVKKFPAKGGAMAGKECRQIVYIGGWGECNSFLCDWFHQKNRDGKITMDDESGTLLVSSRSDSGEIYRLCIEDVPEHINVKEIKEFRLNHLKECYTTFCKMVHDGDVTTVEAAEMHQAIDEIMNLPEL